MSYSLTNIITGSIADDRFTYMVALAKKVIDSVTVKKLFSNKFLNKLLHERMKSWTEKAM